VSQFGSEDFACGRVEATAAGWVERSDTHHMADQQRLPTGLKLGPIWARRVRAGVFRCHRSRPRHGRWASQPCFAWPIIGGGGLDRDVPRSADHLRRSIWVASCISEVTNDRFQRQEELFGKHGDYPSIATAWHGYAVSGLGFVRHVTTTVQIRLPT
jgi:hypothetical protein